MKVSEALDILRQLDSNAEVTLVFGGTVGVQPKYKQFYPYYTPPPPMWVSTPYHQPNITCQNHEIK